MVRQHQFYFLGCRKVTYIVATRLIGWCIHEAYLNELRQVQTVCSRPDYVSRTLMAYTAGQQLQCTKAAKLLAARGGQQALWAQHSIHFTDPAGDAMQSGLGMALVTGQCF